MGTRLGAALFAAPLLSALFLAAACAQDDRGAPLAGTPEAQATGAPAHLSPTPPSSGTPDEPSVRADADFVLHGLPDGPSSFGYSLAAGDIDGDGHDDVIAGGPWPTAPPGKVLAFLGGAGFGEAPDIVLTDPEQGPPTGFGYFLAAGDIDGDSNDEVIVGKPMGGGKVFVFSDPERSPQAPSAVLEDAEHRAGSLLGYPVAVGDVNGDGEEDIIAGAPKLDVGEHADAGAVFVFLGGEPCGPVCDYVLQAPEPETGAWFGRSVAAGDVDGDGLDDVIVGSHGSSVAGHPAAGKVFVFPSSGSPGHASVRILQDPTPGEEARFGYAVAAGDIDGDGYDDIVAGAFGAKADQLALAGRAVVFRGGPDADFAADAVLVDPHPEAGAGFGYVVLAADVSGDGFDDIIIGAPYSNLEGHDAAGEVFIFSGSAEPSYRADASLAPPSPQSQGYFGASLAAGDIDGNGIGDIIVGAYGTDADGQVDAGQVLVFLSTGSSGSD